MENALWVTRMCAYKNSSLHVLSAQNLIAMKIARQAVVLKKYKQVLSVKTSICSSIEEVLLYEARTARQFWKEFGFLLPSWTCFRGRKAKSGDVTNTLLDIGYHHITNLVKKVLIENGVSTTMGIIHVARTADSTPLAYDLVELFRADLAETEVLRFLRLKKKPLLRIRQKDISYLLHRINLRLEKKYYLKDFKQCHTYRYYMELQVLKFISSVNHKQVYTPVQLPFRHESRCS